MKYISMSEVTFLDEVKGKGAHEPKAQTARAYPSFLSMKHAQEYIATPLGWDASPSKGHPPAVCCRYPFIHLGEERQSGA